MVCLMIRTDIGYLCSEQLFVIANSTAGIESVFFAQRIYGGERPKMYRRKQSDYFFNETQCQQGFGSSVKKRLEVWIG
jgi:hypothetical protein